MSVMYPNADVLHTAYIADGLMDRLVRESTRVELRRRINPVCEWLLEREDWGENSTAQTYRMNAMYARKFYGPDAPQTMEYWTGWGYLA